MDTECGARAHIELRALDAVQFDRFAAAVEATFAGLGVSRPAVAPLFGGLPKAALYGRTIFPTELTRTLAVRGALVLPCCAATARRGRARLARGPALLT